MTSAECAAMQDVVTWLSYPSDPFCQGLGAWAEYYYQQGRFSTWNWVGSHHDPQGNTIQIHEDRFASGFNDLVASTSHEIMHGWGIQHDHSPNNFALQDYCTFGYDGSTPPLPPPPPPPWD